MNNIIQGLQKPLTKDDIEMRVGNNSAKGFSLLLYKTARTDVKRLNEVCGLHWKNRHFYDAKGILVCEISIYDTETGQWISREDVGTESNTEKEKGSYSDSFKRAGFKWGIGIELYNPPFLFIKWEMKEYKDNSGKKKYSPVDFYQSNLEITEYEYKDNEMFLTISYNKKNVFSNTGKKVDAVKTETKPVEKITTTTGAWEEAGFTSLAQAKHSFDKAKTSVEAMTDIDTIIEKEADIKKFIAKVKIWDLQIADDLQNAFDKKRSELEGNIPDNTAYNLEGFTELTKK